MDIVQVMTNYGFPIAVALFLLFEYREIRKEITNEIHGKLMEITYSLKSIVETQRNILEIQKEILRTIQIQRREH
jgi:hypothetical protein